MSWEHFLKSKDPVRPKAGYVKTFMKKNTTELWDKYWEKSPRSTKEDKFNHILLENSIIWQRIEAAISTHFGSFKELKVLEIGSGVGSVSALFVQRGSNVTLLDYSEHALSMSKDYFERNGLTANVILQDALKIPSDLYDQFDVSLSFGLTEHFLGTDRISINQAHFDVLKNNGMSFILVPNKHNPPYRLCKFTAELFKFWKVGEEYPYSRKELKKICRAIGISEFFFIGDSLAGSFSFWLNPVRYIKSFLKINPSYNIDRIKKQKGCFLDEYLSYGLCLCGKK